MRRRQEQEEAGGRKKERGGERRKEELGGGHLLKMLRNLHVFWSNVTGAQVLQGFFEKMLFLHWFYKVLSRGVIEAAAAADGELIAYELYSPEVRTRIKFLVGVWWVFGGSLVGLWWVFGRFLVGGRHHRREKF